ncbi:MAG: hypothetical protein M1401_16990 [Chloroflexi bacterium]|nr:hypothetical protein [Chloroflexota bacterium]MCL5110523.1 hypothetical protein [Chloroflexota bacterium]
MEINFCPERIVELQAALTREEVEERALAKRVDVFGQVAKLFQRPKAEDITIAALQLRFEPFWLAAATARYVYERQHVYHVEVPPEVQSVTVEGHEYSAAAGKNPTFDLPALDHCREESRQEMLVDAVSGREGDFKKFLAYGKNEVPDLATLEANGAVVLPPQARSSVVVRKIVTLLMKSFEADTILEDSVDFEELTLYYRPVYAVEYLWAAKQKRQVVEVDALTGDTRTEGGRIVQHVTRVLQNDDLFDIGADTIGTIMPGANIAIKVGRFAARKVIK